MNQRRAFWSANVSAETNQVGEFTKGLLYNKMCGFSENFSHFCDDLCIYIYMLAPPQDPYFYMLAFPKTYNTVHPVHLACLEAKYLVPEGFTVLRIFFFNRALPGSSC